MKCSSMITSGSGLVGRTVTCSSVRSWNGSLGDSAVHVSWIASRQRGSPWAGSRKRTSTSNRSPDRPATVTGRDAPTRRSGCACIQAWRSVGAEARLATRERPIIKTLREALPANRISRLYGILNGTCNYILSRMELEGLTFAECLADAQRLGYAEADPTFDVEGFDTAHKLAILTSLAFGTEIDAEAIYVEGISSIAPLDLAMAKELGFRIKLLGVAERTKTGIEQRVHPTMVPRTSSIAQVMGVTNAVTIDADAVRELTLIGPGAGGDATASAVVADIADVATGNVQPLFGAPTDQLEKAQRAPMQRHEGGYYVRLTVHDRPGVAAGVATRMAEADISLESILQKRSEIAATKDPHGRSGAPVPLVLITYAATEASIRSALEKITGDGLIAEPPQVIRIERE